MFFESRSLGDPEVFSESNWLASGLNLLIALSGFVLLGASIVRRKISWVKYHGLLLICIIALGSILWSVAPTFSLKRALTFVGSIFLLIYFVEQFGADRVFQIIVSQLLIVALISFAGRIAWKQYVLMPGTHALQGVYSHKNVFGAAMAAGVLAASYLYIRYDQRKRLYILAAAFFLFCDFLSTSGTAIVQGLIYFYVLGLYLLGAKRGVTRIVAFLGLIPLGGTIVLAAVAPDVLFGLIGKDATLTGRTDLWVYVIEFIRERPWLGWGFRAFWQSENPLAVDVWNALGWMMPESHNGILELLLNVGYIGCAAFLYVFFGVLVTGVRNLKAGNGAIGIAALTACLGVAFYGVSEDVLINPDMRSIIFYLIAVSGIHEYCRTREAARGVLRRPRPVGFSGNSSVRSGRAFGGLPSPVRTSYDADISTH